MCVHVCVLCGKRVNEWKHKNIYVLLSFPAITADAITTITTIAKSFARVHAWWCGLDVCNIICMATRSLVCVHECVCMRAKQYTFVHAIDDGGGEVKILNGSDGGWW